MIYEKILGDSLSENIIYFCIYHDNMIKFEYLVPSNIRKASLFLFRNRPSSKPRVSYSIGKSYLMHIRNSPPISYLTVTASSFSTVVSFEMLEEIKQKYSEKSHESIESTVKIYSKRGNASKIKRINNVLDQIKQIRPLDFASIYSREFRVKFKKEKTVDQILKEKLPNSKYKDFTDRQKSKQCQILFSWLGLILLIAATVGLLVYLFVI